ncbi:MAG: hypothetical protein PHV16_02495 [Candidatus Nanoarchaeia archaeon]|nr:hypothetical protein [Candidatus Nanoarchaeia archaeon]
MVIFGTYPKVKKDDNIEALFVCPKCKSQATYYVMIHRIPHLFFIPIPFLTSDECPGIVCKNCSTIYELEGELGYYIEQYYLGKKSKKEILDYLKKQKATK